MGILLLLKDLNGIDNDFSNGVMSFIDIYYGYLSHVLVTTNEFPQPKLHALLTF